MAKREDRDLHLFQPQQTGGVVLGDVFAQLVFDVDLLKRRQPAFRTDHRPVRAKQHLLLQNRNVVALQDRREVFRRPANDVELDIGLVLRHRQRLFLLGKARWARMSGKLKSLFGRVVMVASISGKRRSSSEVVRLFWVFADFVLSMGVFARSSNSWRPFFPCFRTCSIGRVSRHSK